MHQEKPLTKDWKSIFEDQKQSQLSQQSFCEKHGINISTFHYHRSKMFGSKSTGAKKRTLVEIKQPGLDLNVDFPKRSSDWKFSISIMGVIALEIRLG